MNHTYSDQSTWSLFLFSSFCSGVSSLLQFLKPNCQALPPAPVSHPLVFSAATQWRLALQAGHWKGTVAVFCMLIVLICQILSWNCNQEVASVSILKIIACGSLWLLQIYDLSKASHCRVKNLKLDFPKLLFIYCFNEQNHFDHQITEWSIH